VLGNTIAQIISKNLNIAPTLEIRPGYRFNVIVTKDMTFSKPYQSFDY
jgi:type IV secretion system protein VirB10